jgi:hypothetical protein
VVASDTMRPRKPRKTGGFCLPLATAASLFFAAACGPKAHEATAPSATTPDVPANDEEPSTPAPSDESEASSAPVASAETKTPPAPPPLTALCETMCGAQTEKCKPEQIEGCRQNYCYRYGGAPDVCEPSVRGALECAQSKPDFLLCSNVIPDSCAKKFRAAEKCVATGVAPPPDPEGPKVPEGFARFESASGKFSVLMPAGVKEVVTGNVRTYSSELRSAVYEITLSEPPKEKKFDQKAFVRIATKLLDRCAPKMKLFAIVEKEDRTMIQFSTTCPDGLQQRGMLYVQGNDYLVLRARWKDGANPDADVFAYSFERK